MKETISVADFSHGLGVKSNEIIRKLMNLGMMVRHNDVIDFETAWARDATEYIDRGLALRADFANEPSIRFALAPHAPYTVSDETLIRIADLSERFDLAVHTHLLETEWEIKQSLQQHEQHPIGRLERHGLLNRRLQAVHQLPFQESTRGARIG